MKEPQGERRSIRDSPTLKQEMLCSIQEIARSDDICVWSCPGKLEANFRTRIPHLLLPSSLPFYLSAAPFLFVAPRFPSAFPMATNRNLFKQAARLTPSSSPIRWEAAVSGLEFTGNNIVARRWPRSECTCHDKVSRRWDATRRLRATFKLPKPVRSFQDSLWLLPFSPLRFTLVFICTMIFWFLPLENFVFQLDVLFCIYFTSSVS